MDLSSQKSLCILSTMDEHEDEMMQRVYLYWIQRVYLPLGRAHFRYVCGVD